MPRKSPREYKEIIELAYTAYEMLGPSRSLAKLAKQGQVEGKPWSNLTTVEGWSSKYNWVKRAAQYDKEEVDREKLELEVKRLKRLKLAEKTDDEQGDAARLLWIKTVKLLSERIDSKDISNNALVLLLKDAWETHRLSTGNITARVANELSSNPESPLTIVANFGLSSPSEKDEE